MKVMLLYPRWIINYGIASHFAKRESIFPPLNLAYLAAIAEKEGHEVRIIDGQAENMPLAKMVEESLAFSPDIIGISSTTPFYHIAIDLATRLKGASKIPIVIGGHHISIMKEKAFNLCFDYAFIGESENSWPMFLGRYPDISSVEGILFRDNGEVKSSGFPKRIESLDSIPFPARHLLKMNKYKLGTIQGRKNFTSIMFSRGCPFQCIFCSTAEVFGKRLRKRAARSVVNEIISVVSAFNIRHFHFPDDNMTIDREYILKLCDLIEKEELQITFEGSTRANLVDEELISKMAQTGLIRMTFGLETVDPGIRRTIKKGVPLESYALACSLTNKYGVETRLSVMLGLPGETEETAKKTLAYLRNARDVHEVQYSIATPYPGTEFYDMAKRGEQGLSLIVNDFSKFRRYGSAVILVGNLSPDKLNRLQNDAFVSIYLVPWRLKNMIKRVGLFGVLLTYFRVIISLWNILSYRASRLKEVF